MNHFSVLFFPFSVQQQCAPPEQRVPTHGVGQRRRDHASGVRGQGDGRASRPTAATFEKGEHAKKHVSGQTFLGRRVCVFRKFGEFESWRVGVFRKFRELQSWGELVDFGSWESWEFVVFFH